MSTPRTAFVIDVFANRILGWECSTPKYSSCTRARHLLHGMMPWIDAVAEAFDNAVAETTIGLQA